jgi:hypothetical protein
LEITSKEKVGFAANNIIGRVRWLSGPRAQAEGDALKLRNSPPQRFKVSATVCDDMMRMKRKRTAVFYLLNSDL